MLHLLLAAESSLSLPEALVGAPVAVVVVAGAFYGWYMLRKGVVVLGREHEELRESKERENDEMREERDWWRDVATRALNIGEAVAARRDQQSIRESG